MGAGKTSAIAAGKSTVALSLILAALFAGSIHRLGQWDRRLRETDARELLSVAALQPNIAQDEKMASYTHPDPGVRARLAEEQTRLHEALVAREVPPATRLLVMPESTLPDLNFQFEPETQRRIERMMAPLKADLIFGAVRWESRDKEPEIVFNTALFLERGGSLAKAPHHDKMRLVPFGEFIPYADRLPRFVETFIGLGSFTEGREVTLFPSQGQHVGTMICFESSFSAQARRLANAGAEVLAVITNDAWYGFSAGPVQHHNLSLLRAVETRRPVIRAANTGISSIIDPAGRVVATLPLGRAGVVTAEIAPQVDPTFYLRWGNRWLVLAALAVVAGSATRLLLPDAKRALQNEDRA